MISETGRNLTILVECKNSPGYSWLAYCTWYSIRMFLPDARYVFACKREPMNFFYLNWLNKVSKKSFIFYENRETVLDNIRGRNWGIDSIDMRVDSFHTFISGIPINKEISIFKSTDEDAYFCVNTSYGISGIDFDNIENKVPSEREVDFAIKKANLTQKKVLEVWKRTFLTFGALIN